MAYTPAEIAQLDRTQQLRVSTHTSLKADGECFLCGGPISHGSWRVKLPVPSNRSMPGPARYAHTHCAGESGFHFR